MTVICLEHAIRFAVGRSQALRIDGLQCVLQQVRLASIVYLSPTNLSISTPAGSLSEGEMEIHDPTEIDHALVKLGMHSLSFQSLLVHPRRLTPSLPDWSNHGICGRGVLLDLVNYYTADGKALPYDPWTTHPISVAELEACAKKQGVTFRQADILILRVGFTQKYYAVHNDTKAALRGGPEVERLYVVSSSSSAR